MEILATPMFKMSMEHLRAGLSADCQHRYRDAAVAYLEGAPLLLQVARGEKLSTAIKELLKSKSQLYLNRIQLIKAKLEAKEEVPANPATLCAQFAKFNVEELEKDSCEFLTNLRQLPFVYSMQDVKGAEQAKEFLWKNVVLPLMFPSFPDPVTRVKKGILLYGLPGTGKTMLMCAVARAVSCPVFRVTVSDFVTRWVKGEVCVERLRDLFRCAQQNQPCLVCFDDLDMVCPSGEQAADSVTTMVREELCAQLKEVTADNLVTVIAATQKPWALTGTLRRRFDRRFYLSLPNVDERVQILAHGFTEIKHQLTNTDIDMLAQATSGYTGCDLSVLVRSCGMSSITAWQMATHCRKVTVTDDQGDQKTEWEMLAPCSPEDPGAIDLTFHFLNPERLWEIPVSRTTVEEELKKSKASMSDDLVQQMEKFHEEFGQED